MKKTISLCLATSLLLLCFAGCGENTVPAETTAESTGVRQYEMDNSELKVCVGMADENGVYVVPDTVTVIGEGAFAGDTKLKKVVIGANVTTIASGAFMNCTALRQVSFSESETLITIGSHAFFGCTSLETVTVPNGVTRIEPYTFSECAAMETASLPSVTVIADSAFAGCMALEKVTLSSPITEIEQYAFSRCVNLEDVNLEDCVKLTVIGDCAFANCTMLSSITLPAGLESIGTLVFYSCTRLTSIVVPDSLRTVGFCAFTYTPWYQENREDYLVVGDGVLIKCTVNPMNINLSGKGIRAIGNSTFWNAVVGGESEDYGYKYASILDKIVLPEGIEEIGSSAFAGCISLTDVVLPSTVTRIESNAFNVYTSSYSSRANIDISACQALTYIGAYAFYGCGGIQEIIVPKSVTAIGAYAYACTDAYNNFLQEARTKTEEKDRYLIVGDGILLAAYVADGQTGVHVPEGVKMLAGSALCGWDTAIVPSSAETLSASGETKYRLTYQVTELTLPSTLLSIGEMSCYRMALVKELVLPASLADIGADAFGLCSALTKITGGSGIKEVGDAAFRYCVALRSFQFSEDTEKIGSSVFYGCSSLKTVYLPKGMAFPGRELFSSDCTEIEAVFIAMSARPRIYDIVGTIIQNISIQYYIEE